MIFPLFRGIRPPRILFHVDPGAEYVPRFQKHLVSGIAQAAASVQNNSEDQHQLDFQTGLVPTDFSPEFLRSAEVLITSPYIGPDDVKKVGTLLPHMENLQWIHSLTAGVDAFSDIIDANLHPSVKKIPLTNARGAYSHSLAEYAIAGLLHFQKNVELLQKNKREKRWDAFRMADLRGKTAGFIGFGSIAQACARLCAAFDMHILAHSRTSVSSGPGEVEVATHFGRAVPGRTGDEGESAGRPKERHSGSQKQTKNRPHTNTSFPVRYTADKVDVFRQSDFVVCSLPFTPTTAHYCDSACFQNAKPGQIFVSLGRGQAVDEAALVKHHERFGGIVMDVFEKEPLTKKSPLWTLPNVLLSSHNADRVPSYERDAVEVFLERYAEFVGEGFEGFRKEVLVDRTQGY